MTTAATTHINTEYQIGNINTYNDQLAAGSGLETTTASLEDNVQAVISQINRILNATVTGNDWFVDINTPASFEGGAQRGVNLLNTDLHNIERKRALRRITMVNLDVPDPGAALSVILALTDLPTNTTAAIGAVTTLGTVVATATTFGTASASDVVTGSNVLQPKNMWGLIDTATGDPIKRLSDDRQMWGLAQSESSTDGSTMTGTTPNRLQVSFVVTNAGYTALELIAPSDMSGFVWDYSYIERVAFDDFTEQDFLGGGFTDTGASTTDRQEAYNNQGTTVVTTTTSSTLDVGVGFTWELGDSASTSVWSIAETAGASVLTIGAAVATYNNNAVDVNFDNGITADNGSNAINVGITADQIDFTGNGTVTSSSGSSMVFGSTSANTTVSTTTSGNVILSSAGNVLVDGAVLSLDGTDTTNLTMTASDAGTKTMTIAATNAGAGVADMLISADGEVDVASTGLMDVNAGAGMDVDVTGAFDMLATTTFSIDGTGASNVTATSGSMTVSTATTGDVLLTSADCILGTIGTAASDHERWASRHHYFGAISSNPNYLTLNAQNTGTSVTGGTVVVTDANTYVPGNTVSASTSTTFTVDAGAPGISAGDFLLVTSASVECVNGLYQIDSVVSGTLTIDTTPDEPFCKSSIGFTGAVTATLFNADVCVMRCNAGTWEVGDGTSGPLTYAALGTTAGSTLQAAYVAGSDIVVSSGNTSVNITGTPNDVTVPLVISGGAHTATTAGEVLAVINDADASGNLVQLTNAGSGVGLDILQTGSGDLLVARTASQNIFEVDGLGEVLITPPAAQDFQATMLTSGNIDFDTASGDFTFDSTSGAFSFDVVGDSNITQTAASGTTTLTFTIDNTGTSGDASVLDLTANATGASGANTATIYLNTAVTSATATGTINVGTVDDTTLNLATGNFTNAVNVLTGTTASAFTLGTNAAHTVDVGDGSTGAVTVNSGTSVGLDVGGSVTLDMATTGFTAGGDWVLTIPTKYAAVSSATDPTSNTTVGITDFVTSNFNLANGTVGNVYQKFGAGGSAYTGTTDTTSGEVHVVSCDGTATGTSVSFTAGVGPATSAPSVTLGVGEGANFTVGNFIVVTAATNRENCGVFRIIGISTDTLTIYGVGGTAVTDTWLNSQFTGGADTGATVCEVTLTIFRQNAGVMEFAENVTGGAVTYTTLASGVTTLQEAYTTSAGADPSITTTAALDSVSVGGTVNAVVAGGYFSVGLATHTGATASPAVAITGTPLNSATVFTVTDDSTESAIAAEFVNSGDGEGVVITNTATANGFRITTGATDHVVVGSDGTSTFVPDANGDFTVTTSGVSGFVDINTGAAGFDVTATAGPVALTTTGAGDVTVTSGRQVNVSAADEIDFTSDCVGIHANSGAEDTSSFHSEMERFQLWGTTATTTNGSFIGMNVQRVSTTAKGAGSWVALSTSAAVTSTITATTAAVAATTDPTVTVASSTPFAAGDLVTLSGTANECNYDIYEVAATPTGTTITLRGPNGVTARTLGFTGLDLVSAGAGGTIQKVTATIIQCDTAGNWQQGVGDDDTITFSNFQGATSLEAAWGNATGAGATLGLSGFTGSITDSDTYLIQTLTGSNNLLSLAAVSGADVVTLGNADTATVVDIDSGTGGTLVDSTGAISLGAAAASDFTVTGANLDLTTVTTGAITVDSIGTLTLQTTDTGTPADVAITAGTTTTATNSGANVTVSSGSGLTTGSSGNITVSTPAATGTAGAGTGTLTFSTGNPGDVAGSISGSVSITSGGAAPFNTTGGDSGNVSMGSGGVFGAGTFSGNVTISAGSDVSIGGSGASPGSISLLGGSGDLDTGDAAATGTVSITGASNSGSSIAGVVTVTGGLNSGTGAPGALTLAAGAKATSNGAGAIASMAGGAGFGTGGGGVSSVTGGAGGATGAGALSSVTGGAGGATSGNAGGATVAGGVPVDGDGGTVTVSGTAGVGTSRSGGNVTITSGANTTGGTAGFVSVGTGSGAAITQGNIVLTFDNNGSGTGGGQDMSVYNGTAAPTHSANTGSVFLLDDGSTGAVYVNQSSGGSGTVWSALVDAGAQVRRQFFQTDMTSAVSPGSAITSADVTGTLPTRPSSDFTWELDAEVYLNGVLLMNTTTATANEVDAATANATDIDVESGGPAFRIGDIITIIYYTNSTS